MQMHWFMPDGVARQAPARGAKGQARHIGNTLLPQTSLPRLTAPDGAIQRRRLRGDAVGHTGVGAAQQSKVLLQGLRASAEGCQQLSVCGTGAQAALGAAHPCRQGALSSWPGLPPRRRAHLHERQRAAAPRRLGPGAAGGGGAPAELPARHRIVGGAHKGHHHLRWAGTVHQPCRRQPLQAWARGRRAAATGCSPLRCRTSGRSAAHQVRSSLSRRHSAVRRTARSLQGALTCISGKDPGPLQRCSPTQRFPGCEQLQPSQAALTNQPAPTCRRPRQQRRSAASHPQMPATAAEPCRRRCRCWMRCRRLSPIRLPRRLAAAPPAAAGDAGRPSPRARGPRPGGRRVAGAHGP